MRRSPGRKKPKLRISPAQWRRTATELGLSLQQTRLVRLILEGRHDKDIARRLKLRLPTVRTYLARIFQRTGARNRVDLLLYVCAFLMEDCRQNGRHHE